MVRSELIEALQHKNRDLDRTHVVRIVDVFFATIARQLANGGRVEVRGFGTFFVGERDGRNFRNPQTGEALVPEPKRVARFRASKPLLARLN